jgi:hypothetical protein
MIAYDGTDATSTEVQPKKFMLKNDNMKKLYPQVISSCQAEQIKAQEGKALDKILKFIYGLKAEVGTLRKAMDQHGISTDGKPDKNRNSQGLPRKKKKWEISKPSL